MIARLSVVAAASALLPAPALAQGEAEPRPWSIEEIEGECTDPVLMVASGPISDAGFPAPQDRPGYGQALRASGVYDRFDGFYLAGGAPLEVFEGAFERELFLVAEFPCREAARHWFHSVDYQTIIPLRDGAGDFRLAIWDKREKSQMNWVEAEAERGAPDAPPAMPFEANYQCTDAQAMSVAFSQDQAVITRPGGEALTLPAAATERGFHYAADGARLRGLSQAATLERSGEETVICTRTD